VSLRQPWPWESEQAPLRTPDGVYRSGPPRDPAESLTIVADTSAWDRALTSRDDTGDDPTPAQHHESRAASEDRAYHIARQGGVTRSEARAVAREAVERAYRSRGA
jgi:hypothetical protein